MTSSIQHSSPSQIKLSATRNTDLRIAVGLVLILAVLPLMIDSRYLIGQVILAMFYAIIATQWNLLFGFAGIFSLAQMAVFALGGYATAMLCSYLGWPMALAIAAAALGTAFVSVLIGLACLRLAGVYVSLLTLAIAQAMYVLIVSDTECFTMVASQCRQFTGGAVGFARFGDLGMRALLEDQWLWGNYAIVLCLFALCSGFTYFIIHSPMGLAFKALRDNPGYAIARGVNRFQSQLLVFGFSAFFTGLAGGVYAAHFQAIGPSILSWSQFNFIIAITVVGGTGNFWGPIVGTLILMAADELMREMGEFRILGLGLIIAASVVWMPKGLLGRVQDLQQWWRRKQQSHHHLKSSPNH
jgi:branched-chain amino acid transport system permease protein